jgi:hypothetical protein
MACGNFKQDKLPSPHFNTFLGKGAIFPIMEVYSCGMRPNVGIFLTKKFKMKKSKYVTAQETAKYKIYFETNFVYTTVNGSPVPCAS